MKPHQIISLMTPADFGGADNILSLPDHYNHIHVGFHPMYNSSDGQGALKAGQWIKLIDRLNNIDNPTVPVKPSKDAIPVKPGDHAGVDRYFRFAQFEFPWVLGRPMGAMSCGRPGAEEPEHVLVVRTLGAPPRQRRRRRPVTWSPSPCRRRCPPRARR